MVRPRNKTEKLLLPITENCEQSLNKLTQNHMKR